MYFPVIRFIFYRLSAVLQKIYAVSKYLQRQVVLPIFSRNISCNKYAKQMRK